MSAGFDALDGEAVLAAIRERMLAALPSGDPHPELDRFAALQRDYPRRPGKALRGRVVVLSAAAHGATDWDAALTVAAAVELFQAWVLVHDDIEDGSEERRGAPTLHRLAGVPVAINVGDAMHAHMWRLLHGLLGQGPEEGSRAGVAPRVLDEFGTMVSRTAAGQHLDLAWVETGRFDVGEDEYLRMVTLKTAWYTVASPLRLGAILAGREPSAHLTRAGLDLGAAFQVRDDVLNLQSGAAEAGYGKEELGDLYEAKRTLMLAHLLGAAPPAVADEVVRLLSGPRAERTREGALRVLELMRAHGSLAHAQAVARRLAASGLAALDEALAGAPSPRASAALRRELAAVAERSR
ncbi:MAG TPA: polyprenyl synthetase family protein [Trueperaceae bacterium]